MDEFERPEVLRGLKRTKVPFYGVVYKVPKGRPWPPADEPQPLAWTWGPALTALAVTGTMLVTFLLAVITFRR